MTPIEAVELEIEVSPKEPRANINHEIDTASALHDDLADCTRPGDAEGALRYILDNYGVRFTIQCEKLEWKYREATDAELAETCREIYFESDSDFSDRDTAELYILWQAASDYCEG